MKKTILLSSLLFTVSLLGSEQVLQEISWSQLKKDGKLQVGEVLAPDAQTKFERLKIEINQQNRGKGHLNLLTLENPPITSTQYALTGQIKYGNVQCNAYLEMYIYFPGGVRSSSQEQNHAGPMRNLEGSSEWRPFRLPFVSKPGMPAPATVLLNALLFGDGVIYLKEVKLVQTQPGWWSDRTGGIIGGILGSLLGCVGALTGILSSLGKARGLVVGVLIASIACGVISLVLGAIALCAAQPYAVYYPLLLLGGLATVLPASLLSTIRKRYEALELRKMQARDA